MGFNSLNLSASPGRQPAAALAPLHPSDGPCTRSHALNHKKGTVPSLAGLLPLSHPAQRQMLPVKSPAGGHAPRKAPHSRLLEIRDTENIGSNDGDGVGGVHKEAVFPKNHVAILVKTREKQLSSPLSAKRLQWAKFYDSMILSCSTWQAQPINPMAHRGFWLH